MKSWKNVPSQMNGWQRTMAMRRTQRLTELRLGGLGRAHLKGHHVLEIKDVLLLETEKAEEEKPVEAHLRVPALETKQNPVQLPGRKAQMQLMRLRNEAQLGI